MVPPSRLYIRIHHSNIMHFSLRHQIFALGLKYDLLPSCFSDQNPIGICLFPHACYMPRSSYHPNNIWWRLDIMNLGIKQLSPVPCNFFPLRSRYLSEHPFSTILSVWCSLKLKHQESQPCIQQENYSLVYFRLYTSLCKTASHILK